MEIGSLTSLASFSLAALIAFVGGFRFVVAQGDALRREIGASTDNLRREIAASSKENALLIDKVAESEAKQRHATANNVQANMAKLELELRTLQRETVRREQMDALENRLNGQLNKIEVKVDRLAQGLTEIGAIKAQIDAVKSQMGTVLTAISRISDRLDEDNGRRLNTRVS